MIQIKNSTVAAKDSTSFLQSFDSFMQRKEIGFKDLPERSDLWARSEQLGKDLRSRFSDLIVVGIGGSSLGVQVLIETMPVDPKHQVQVWDFVDAVEFERKFSALRQPEKTVFAFISKSGGTLETLGLAEFIHASLQQKNLDLTKQAVVVTEEKASALYDWAQKNSIPSLPVPLDVGGRYSILSPVGLLPAAFLGMNLTELREGARRALLAKNEIAQVAAEVVASWKREEWLTSFWYYAGGTRFMGLWLEQLWAESLAKKTTRSGQPAPRVSTPWCLVGPQDQHSVLQQLAEGTHDKFVIFMRFLDREKAGAKLNSIQFQGDSSPTGLLKGRNLGKALSTLAEATEQGIKEHGVSTLRIEMESLDARGLGFYFMYMQLLVAVLGESIQINAFDQPGVELGKRLARKILEKFD